MKYLVDAEYVVRALAQNAGVQAVIDRTHPAEDIRIRVHRGKGVVETRLSERRLLDVHGHSLDEFAHLLKEAFDMALDGLNELELPSAPSAGKVIP